MERPVKRIVIVGGGTAGWLAASLIAARMKDIPARSVEVTLVEAPDIPTIGVGEGTWPTMRATLASIGIREADFLAACDASFKQGSRFDGWRTGQSDDRYYHPFTAPPSATPADLVATWQHVAPDQPFAPVVSAQPAICDANLAPRQRSMPDGAGALNYAYHLDAAKLAALLRTHAVDRLGVTHVRDHVVRVEADGEGGIAAVVGRDHGAIAGDLFLDCSGHAALLIGGHFGVPFIDRSVHLFNDRALAVQVPVAPGSPVASQTVGTAHQAGWLWDIALPTRRGIGCVYASRFMDDATAEDVLRDYVSRAVPGADPDALAIRKLAFPTGHRAEFWRGNCLAVGLSAGFIEPLEASAIVLIELSLKALLDNFPASRDAMDVHARRFNALFTTRWERIVEFLKLHYVLSERYEPYWRAQRDPASFPDRFADLLRLWGDQPPGPYDLPLADEMFPAASYQYVWYGMGGAIPSVLPPASRALHAQFDDIHQKGRALAAALPSNRAYLDALVAAASPSPAPVESLS